MESTANRNSDVFMDLLTPNSTVSDTAIPRLGLGVPQPGFPHIVESPEETLTVRNVAQSDQNLFRLGRRVLVNISSSTVLY